MRRRSWLLLIFFAVVVQPARTPIAADAPTYTIEDLGVIDGVVPVVTGINDAGQVSGWVSGPTGVRAVRFTDGIGWAYLPGVVAYSIATGINQHGDLSGYRVTSAGLLRGFRFTDAGGVEDIAPLPNGTMSIAMAINASGEVVGYGDTPAGLRAWRASPGVPASLLPGLGGGYQIACAINDAGQIAGSATTAVGRTHATRVDPDNTIVDANSFDGERGTSQSCALDGDGGFGGSASHAGASEAFVYRGGTLTNVTAGLASSSSTITSLAAGVGVGWFVNGAGAVHAFVHDPVNGSIDLNTRIPADSGWELQQALGVNAKGQIIGVGLLNGQTRVFRVSAGQAADTTPPAIVSLAATPSSIVPPNKSMVPVTVAIVASDDRDASPLCALTGIDAPLAGDAVVTGPFTASVRAIGGRTYSMRVTCADAAGNHTDGAVDVVVPPDTTAPVITGLSVTPSAIWPPNKRMVPVAVAMTAVDDSEVTPSCRITDIGANEGSSSDYAVTGPLSAAVRAWRLGNGSGRIYTIGVACSDEAGNTASSSVKVTVAHDRS